MIERVRTGVDGLDEVIGGGFPRGSLILLAGEPGTGKTAFSVNFIAKGAVSGEPGVYAGFAEEKEALMECMGGHLAADLRGLEAEGKAKFLDFTAMREEGASAILERILDEVERMGAKRLAIDSFSAMAQALRDRMEVRMVAQTVLGRIVRRMGCTTIMVEEVPIGESKIGFGVEEFVADGIMRLRAGEVDGRLLRDLELVKLRSTELIERRLAFTLKGGFRVFASFKPKPIEERRRFEPIPDPPGRFSTGSRDLDLALRGGVPRGSIALLEIAERISTLEYHLLIGPMAPEFASQGRGVVVVPSIGIDAEILRGVGRAYGATEDEFNRLIRIVYLGIPEPEEASPSIVAFKGRDWEEDLKGVVKVADELRAKTGQPNLWIVGLDTLVDCYGEDICERIMNYAAIVIRRRKSMLFALLKAGRKQLAKRLSPIADIYLRLIREHGCPLLYGIKPRTGLYAVEMDVEKGHPLPKLTPIV
ncbi:MAG: ATPase domain-containing protein [Candidatus Bathyarchaeia archaeon]